jgi:hypothetical protein
MKQKRYTTSVDFYRSTAKRYLERKSKTSHRPHKEDKQRKAIGEVRGYNENDSDGIKPKPMPTPAHTPNPNPDPNPSHQPTLPFLRKESP